MEQFRDEDTELSASPEQREQLMVGSVAIPADEDQSLRQRQLPASGLQERQALVGGHLEGVSLIEPEARMLVNEDGKYLGLPLNRRATLLVWMHNKPMRYGDVLVGDVVLLGYPDGDGLDTTVPDGLTERLFAADRFRVEAQLQGSEGWYASRQRFGDWVDAYDHALRVGHKQSAIIADVRVIPEADNEA
jgi:hypothetical protein